MPHLLERYISAESLKSGYVTPAEIAKIVRAALKNHFPHTKFSVRTHTYSGGASIESLGSTALVPRSWTGSPISSRAVTSMAASI